MKKLITITAMLMLVTSTANAGSWLKVERPCGSKCQPPQPTSPTSPSWWPTLGVRPGSVYVPDYVSRSTMTITQSDGSTSTINSIYRSYR